MVTFRFKLSQMEQLVSATWLGLFPKELENQLQDETESHSENSVNEVLQQYLQEWIGKEERQEFRRAKTKINFELNNENDRYFRIPCNYGPFPFILVPSFFLKIFIYFITLFCFPHKPQEPILPYFFCKLLVSGGEVWAERGFMLERLYISHSARCKYKWCNLLLGRYLFPIFYLYLFSLMFMRDCTSQEPNVVLRGTHNPILAVYCSPTCAMLDRQELLACIRFYAFFIFRFHYLVFVFENHIAINRTARKSFRFLVHRTPEDVRLLRILRMVHEELKQRLRMQAM